MVATVDNVWMHNEGTVVVDPVSTGDLWTFGGHGVSKQNAHYRSQIDMDRRRIQSVRRGQAIEASMSAQGAGSPPTLQSAFRNPEGTYFSPANCGIGGFRGVPRLVDGVAVIGNAPIGDGEAPAITRLIQLNALPSKSRGVIESEIRDHQRWAHVQMNYKNEMRRP